jgi:hypothetical protein
MAEWEMLGFGYMGGLFAILTVCIGLAIMHWAEKHY